MTETSDIRESHLRSVLKTVSYRIIGTVTTWLLAWSVTGDMGTALTIGALEPVAKMVIYYFHERARQQVPRGTVRRLIHRHG